MSSIDRIEYSFNIWDWNVAWTDFDLYRRIVPQLRSLGFTKVELGVPWWCSAEADDRVDLSETDRRIEEATRHGLDVRLRINAQDPPDWVSLAPSRLPDGTPFDKGYGRSRVLPSLFDDENVGRQREWISCVAAHYRGRAMEYSLGIGLHFELKFGGWNTHDDAARQAFAATFGGRLEAGKGMPPVPARTSALTSDWRVPLAESTVAWIRLREQRLNGVVADLHGAIRRADPTAIISAPLGEAFRAQSAEFSNQDIAGLSRTADNVVFSFDFFIHSPDEPEIVEEVVATYLDVCGRPMRIELDGIGEGAYERFGDDGMYRVAEAALRAGATGINVANFTQERRWVEDLGQFEFLSRIGELVHSARPVVRPEPQTLIYVSKWTQYAYREPTEWVRRAQYGLVRAIRTSRPVRILTDENVESIDLDPAIPLVIPWAPVIDERAAGHLLRELRERPSLRDLLTGELCVSDSVTNWRTRFDEAFGSRATVPVPMLDAIDVRSPDAGLPNGRRHVRSGDDVQLPALAYDGPAWATNGSPEHRFLVVRTSAPRRVTLGFALGMEPDTRIPNAAMVGSLLDWLTGARRD